MSEFSPKPEPNLPPYEKYGEFPRSFSGSSSYSIDVGDVSTVAIYIAQGEPGNGDQLGIRVNNETGDYYHAGVDGTITTQDSSVPLPNAKFVGGTWIEIASPDDRPTGTIEPAYAGNGTPSSPATAFHSVYIYDGLNSIQIINREASSAFDLNEVEVYAR